GDLRREPGERSFPNRDTLRRYPLDRGIDARRFLDACSLIDQNERASGRHRSEQFRLEWIADPLGRVLAHTEANGDHGTSLGLRLRRNVSPALFPESFQNPSPGERPKRFIAIPAVRAAFKKVVA